MDDTGDVAPRSPWVAQLEPDPPPRPLQRDTTTDIVIVGAGIAGIATAFFTLRATPHRVLLLERSRVGRGATGHNAGQLTTYFERPLHRIAEEFGLEKAVAAQRGIEGAHDLLDMMCAEAGADLRIERFIGRLGMFTLNHLEVHLRDNLVRRAGGLPVRDCAVSEEADFLGDIPHDLDGLYSVVTQREIRELLELDDDRYRAVLSEPKGCANSALLVQRVLAHLERAFPERFRYADHTRVDRIVLDGDGAIVHTAGADVRAATVVLCTNGFVDHVVELASGERLPPPLGREVISTIGFMSAFFETQPRPATAMSYIRNEVIGSTTPYVYITRRTYDAPDATRTLTCMGGPEHPVDGTTYDSTTPYPAEMVRHMDQVLRPYGQPRRPEGVPFDFAWHGLMGYTGDGVRLIGPDPRHPALQYNLGCNGIGFLPSIYGGDRIARLNAGEQLEPSIFDPAMIIRDGREGEAEALAELQHQASLVWDDQREWLLSHLEFVEESRIDLSRQIPAGFVRVAEDDGEVIGFSVAVPEDDGEADLDGLFVAPSRMRTGVGAALVADAAERLRRQGVHRLMVLANLNALAFYERVGFVAVELRETAFTPAMWMELLIPPPSTPA